MTARSGRGAAGEVVLVIGGAPAAEADLDAAGGGAAVGRGRRQAAGGRQVVGELTGIGANALYRELST